MFENLSHLTLQHYWWAIISILGAFLVFLMFIQGGQTLIFSIGKTKDERTILLNALGRKWGTTFTTLVTFGGAFFASFPLFYATSFGGAYWLWYLILMVFIIQAVSYEFRQKPANFLGARTYEVLLIINGLLGTILIGAAVGSFFNGADFKLNEMNQVIWQNSTRGLETLLNFHNVALGLSVFFLARTLALLYFIYTIDHDLIVYRSKRHLLFTSALFLIFFLYFLTQLLLKKGFALNPDTGEIFIEKYKYLHNLLQMPLAVIIMLIGVAGVLWGIISSLFFKNMKGFIFAGPGTVLTVFALLIIAGYNNTAFYPSTADLQSSLTIQNASSSHFTLISMSYVSLIIPFVFAYIYYFWKVMNRKKITDKEMQEEVDIY